MVEAKYCPVCGCELPSDSPAGLCPDCLLKQGLDSQQSRLQAANGSVFAPTTPQSGDFIPLDPDRLAVHFPHLQILQLLGHGGMGAVYLARQLKLDRLVALKIIRSESADNPAFAERFNREARTLARLSHPHIVAIHDFGEIVPDDSSSENPRTLYYFLMEYVDGTNLRQLIEPGNLPPRVALAIIPQICDALQYAHDEGVIHRDIKPENILLDQRGRVKIADFGLAKLAARSDADFTLTGTHQVMGTPRYMAPEQMEGSHTVDHRADIYSLGVVLYEMLTGHIPAGHFEPPSNKAQVDSQLDDVVLRALARDPDFRFQYASELGASVKSISRASDEPNSLSTSGHAGRTSDAGWSTLAERELLGAWRWMRGEAGDRPGRNAAAGQQPYPAFPGLLMIALSLLGGLLTLAPWMDLQITDPDVTNGMEAAQLANIGGREAYVLTVFGVDHWPGIVTAVLLTGLAVLLLVTPATRTLSWRRAGGMTVLAACALLSTFLFKAELEAINFTFRYVSNPAPAGETSPGIPNTRPLSHLDHQIQPQVAYFATVALSAVLLVLSGLGVRHAAARRPVRERPQPDSEKQTPQISKWATAGAGLVIRRVWRNIIGNSTQRSGASRSQGTPLANRRFTVDASCNVLSQALIHFTSLGYQLIERESDVYVFQRGTKWASLYERNIRTYHTTLTVRVAPKELGTQWVICNWTVRTLGAWVFSHDIRVLKDEGFQFEAFLNGVPDRAVAGNIRAELDGPSLALMVVGLLIIMGHLLLMVSAPEGQKDKILLPIPGLLVGLTMFVGGLNVRKIWSRGWSQLGAFAALVPAGPGWLLSLPIGVWALRVLARPDVRKAFADQTSRRDDWGM